jgi:hypothetical protein
MRKTYIVDNEPYEYDDVMDEAINTALERVPTIVFLNKIQSFVNKFDFEITVFGEGDDEHGKYYECKVKQGFNSIIYEAPETSNRTDGILNCFEWLITNNKLKLMFLIEKCTHTRTKIENNGFYYCSDCGSQVNVNMQM